MFSKLRKWSEYWKSTNKHWCIYCKIFITDNKPSRSIHEKGTKHALNVQQYLQDVDSQKKKQIRKDNKVANILSGIENAANKSFLDDAALGHTSASDYSRAQTISLEAAAKLERKIKNKETKKALKDPIPAYTPDPVYPVENEVEYAGVKDSAGLGPWLPVIPQLNTDTTIYTHTNSSYTSKSSNHTSTSNDRPSEKRPLDDTDDPDDLGSFDLDKKLPVPPPTTTLASKNQKSDSSPAVFKKRKKPQNIISKKSS
ncbi:WW domain-binding protein 4 [Smittium mucronatum]|uniref:WW domain-binding protein 4 n=1 Tax=Smittium mucronatum TaxID=133383 RepID=A0A1R0GXY1_9FUNG|nr:WW domain-binding protein 4 [Smittium mucronatum]